VWEERGSGAEPTGVRILLCFLSSAISTAARRGSSVGRTRSVGVQAALKTYVLDSHQRPQLKLSQEFLFYHEKNDDQPDLELNSDSDSSTSVIRRQIY
jgi:hypothetical protein